MSSLLVITGPPGAGKSTVAALLAQQFEPSALVEGDAFFAFLARGAIAPWLPESNAQNEVVTKAAAAAAGHYAAGGLTTLFDGIVGAWFLPTFARATGLSELDYVVLLPSVEQCLERVATRLGHGFTDAAATAKMHHEFANALIDPRHVLHDPPAEPGEVVDLIVAERERGTLEYRQSVSYHGTP